jgi:arginase
MTDFVCIGVPYYIGERIDSRTEVEMIRSSGIVEELKAKWVDIEPDFAASPDPVTAVNRALKDAIKAHSERTPIIFAGDCCCLLGAMKGLEALHPVVLWYDAHGDFNTPETTPSGFLGGMPLAWLVGRGHMQYMEGVDLQPISEKDVIAIDVRDLDPGEYENLHGSDVTILSNVDDLLTFDLPDKPVYLHMDIDIIDPDEMPGLGYPAPGGPSVERVANTVTRVAQDAQVAGMLFSLFNGGAEGADRALAGVLRLIRALAAGS